MAQENPNNKEQADKKGEQRASRNVTYMRTPEQIESLKRLAGTFRPEQIVHVVEDVLTGCNGTVVRVNADKGIVLVNFGGTTRYWYPSNYIKPV